jgi:hypothetical protein
MFRHGCEITDLDSEFLGFASLAIAGLVVISWKERKISIADSLRQGFSWSRRMAFAQHCQGSDTGSFIESSWENMMGLVHKSSWRKKRVNDSLHRELSSSVSASPLCGKISGPMVFHTASVATF